MEQPKPVRGAGRASRLERAVGDEEERGAEAAVEGEHALLAHDPRHLGRLRATLTARLTSSHRVRTTASAMPR